MDAIAIVVEDGEKVEQPQARQSEQVEDENSTILGSRVLAFFWRVIARVTECFSRIRRFFVFTPTKENSEPGFKEERGISENGIKAEDSQVVEASGANSTPELAEIIVFEKECTNIHQIGQESRDHADSHPEELLHRDSDDDNFFTLQIKVDEHQSGISVNDYDSVEEVIIELRKDDVLQINVDSDQSGDCEECIPTQSNIDNHDTSKTELCAFTVEASPLECTAEAQHDHIECRAQKQNTSREDDREFVEVNKCIVLQAHSPSNAACNSQTEEGSESQLEPRISTASSECLKRKISIQQMDAIVAEQLTKFSQQAFEYEKAADSQYSTLSQSRTTHARALVLATLVAVAVWARNAKHLHESMPRIKGTAINVHVKSRL